jgi:hypothetical protein
MVLAAIAKIAFTDEQEHAPIAIFEGPRFDALRC